MRKVHYLYADFETTQIKLPKEYKNYKDFYEKCKYPIVPQVYSWNILYDSSYKKLMNENFSTGKKLSDTFNFNYGINGNSFIESIEQLKVDAVMYFNNLKGFDGHFILPLLDKAGYEPVPPFNILESPEEIDDYQVWQVVERTEKLLEVVKSQPEVIKKELKILSNVKITLDEQNTRIKRMYIREVKKIWNLLLPKEYSVISNKNKHIYEIKIGLESQKRTKGYKKYRALTIRDNLLLFPSSIQNMGSTISKYLLNKGKIELKDAHLFHKYDLSSGYKRYDLYKNVEEFKNDGNELKYLVQDTYILWKFHKLIEKYIPRKNWKMTIASTSYNDWSNKLSKHFIDKFVKSGHAEIVKEKRGIKRVLYNDKKYSTNKFGEVIRNKLFPTKWLNNIEKDISVWEHLYDWYSGGLTFVNEKYRGQYIKRVTFIDINSSYPAQMIKELTTPRGEGVKGDVKGYDFKYYRVIPKVRIKNTKGLPFLYEVDSETRDYVSVLEPNREYRLTTHSLPRFKKYYCNDESKYTLIVDWSFKTCKLSDIFGDFVTEWSEIKSQAKRENNPILEFIAKLYQNSNYGKHGTKKIRESTLWNPDTQEWNGVTEEVDAKYYLPHAISITELGRMALVDAVGNNYSKVAYGDTDSLAIVDFKEKDFPNVKFDKTKLGLWDKEYENLYGIVRRTKQYMFLEEGNEDTLKIAFAGINFNKFLLSDEEVKEVEELEKEYRKISLIDFVKGKKINNQMAPFRLLGSGIILTDNNEKNIKPVWSIDPTKTKKKEREIYPLKKEQKYFLPKHFISTIEQLQNEKRITSIPRKKQSNCEQCNY